MHRGDHRAVQVSVLQLHRDLDVRLSRAAIADEELQHLAAIHQRRIQLEGLPGLRAPRRRVQQRGLLRVDGGRDEHHGTEDERAGKNGLQD
ncbi:hypothetical protein KH5H1_57680 [Corallococcus caeni]|nr:hypothetical protein KH5H1_57680 [Corallococcus sp. KH5-1]